MTIVHKNYKIFLQIAAERKYKGAENGNKLSTSKLHLNSYFKKRIHQDLYIFTFIESSSSIVWRAISESKVRLIKQSVLLFHMSCKCITTI